MSESLRQKQARVRALREKAQRSKVSISKITPTTPTRKGLDDASTTTASPVTPELSYTTVDPSKLGINDSFVAVNNNEDMNVPALSGAGVDSNDDEVVYSEDQTPSSTRSKSSAIKERLRKQEAQLAMLRRRLTLRNSQSSMEENQAPPTGSLVSSSPAVFSPGVSSNSSSSAMNDRTKELLAMTARKKKEVAGRKRRLSSMELQRETIKAIETATARLETLS
mmetsp:Transcript_2527/g.7025  ORF Transcript_2527/g.7025 Transcript_2527/m.7025 type:complete len:223 (+) Transcript_2527:213-881(+)